MPHRYEWILNAAKNSAPSEEQLAEWAKRDAEGEKLQTYDWIHRNSQPQRTALTGWTGRTLDIENIQYSPEFAIEQGYDDPKAGILFANWNDCSQRVMSILERAGYSCEWEDEFTTCSNCGKALRTSADSYGWQPSYADYSEDGELLCLECVDPSDYLERLEDKPTKALNLPNIDPSEHGYTLLKDGFEHGFHPGQTDDPKTIYAELVKQGHKRILFQISDVGQFDIGFAVWVKFDWNKGMDDAIDLLQGIQSDIISDDTVTIEQYEAFSRVIKYLRAEVQQ